MAKEGMGRFFSNVEWTVEIIWAFYKGLVLSRSDNIILPIMSHPSPLILVMAKWLTWPIKYEWK